MPKFYFGYYSYNGRTGSVCWSDAVPNVVPTFWQTEIPEEEFLASLGDLELKYGWKEPEKS